MQHLQVHELMSDMAKKKTSQRFILTRNADKVSRYNLLQQYQYELQETLKVELQVHNFWHDPRNDCLQGYNT